MADSSSDDTLLHRLREALAAQYSVLHEIGRGASGIVFKAQERSTGRVVAIKVLRPELAQERGADRFLREIRIGASVQHPHIAALLASGTVDGLPWFSMLFVEGESLSVRLRRERQIPVPVAVRIARQIALALGAAHTRGVVHRDISPNNVMLSGEVAVVTDFGIARAIAGSESDRVTSKGIAVGTPQYMSPEQAEGGDAIDGRSDLYSLGCVMYEMLTGEPPFHGRTPQALVARHRSDTPPPMRIVRDAVSPELEGVVARALAKLPADRFASAEEFIWALDRVPLGSRGDVPKPPKLKRLVLLGAALALVVAIVLVVRRIYPSPTLDANHIVIFPLREAGLQPSDAGMGDAAATFMGYALENTEPLRWLDGGDLTGHGGREAASTLPAKEASRLARSAGAAFFIDGQVLRENDSAVVMLSLHGVGGDSVVRKAREAAAHDVVPFPRLALRALSKLLPSLLAPGRRIDLTMLADRDAAAIAHFLQGEEMYRAMDFAGALLQDTSALAADSSFALAAARGASAAHGRDLPVLARELADIALRDSTALPKRYRPVARGIQAFGRGAADSAILWFTRARDDDSLRADVWYGLGEVYHHLLPTSDSAGALAWNAYQRAFGVDSAHTPALFHLAEIALRRGDTSYAVRLRPRLDFRGPDSLQAYQVDLMRRCIERPLTLRQWEDEARLHSSAVLSAGKLLSVRAESPTCAEAALRAVLTNDTDSVSDRWGALLSLAGLDVARSDSASLSRLLRVAPGDLPAWSVALLADAVWRRNDGYADSIVAARGTSWAEMRPTWLWILATWKSEARQTADLVDIAKAMRAKLDSTPNRRDSLLARVLDARVSLAGRDTADAIHRLRRLVPNAPEEELTWQPWEALALERLRLAELLLARGDAAGALRTAEPLDAPEPVVHLMTLRRSLELRERASKSLGQAAQVQTLRERLQRLRAHPSP
ncbi:MAG: serine/threonine-protein kinase [Gemmatimonadaceae bacterium]